MSLFKHIEDSVSQFWHESLSPWLKNFLVNIVHHEVDAVLPIARAFVQQEAQGFLSAAETGDLSLFAQSQATVFLNTVNTLKTTGLKVLGTSVSAAVTAAIADHAATLTTVQKP